MENATKLRSICSNSKKDKLDLDTPTVNEPQKVYYGVINEDHFTLITPRSIDGDECETLSEAFDQAKDMILNGVSEVSIVRAKYSVKHQLWVEDDLGSITIEARVKSDFMEDT
jgi:hypothetical protein